MSGLFSPKIPAPPPIETPPTRLGDEGEIGEAVERERKRRLAATGRESTILGGSTAGATPYRKTLLGE